MDQKKLEKLAKLEEALKKLTEYSLEQAKHLSDEELDLAIAHLNYEIKQNK